jgi:hypothetical protein
MVGTASVEPSSTQAHTVPEVLAAPIEDLGESMRQEQLEENSSLDEPVNMHYVDPTVCAGPLRMLAMVDQKSDTSLDSW